MFKPHLPLLLDGGSAQYIEVEFVLRQVPGLSRHSQAFVLIRTVAMWTRLWLGWGMDVFRTQKQVFDGFCIWSWMSVGKHTHNIPQ